MRTVFAVLLSGLFLAACRGDSSGDDIAVDAPGGNDNKIQDIQNESMPAGTAVTVKGVVVTAIDIYGAHKGDILVEEPEGGAYAGIKIFNPPVDQISALAVGDVVDITGGVKDEFALNSDTSGRTVTEIKAASGGMLMISKVGTGPIPAPGTMDALALAAMSMSDRQTELEKWEGTLVTVTNALQTSATHSVGSGEDQMTFDITGGLQVESALAALPATSVLETCYSGITGFGDYIAGYDLLVPRGESDLVAGGTNCESLTTQSVAAIQMGTATGSVTLTNVYVIGRDDIASSFGVWIADSLQGAEYNGVYVYVGTTKADAMYEIGAKVNVSAKTTEFDTGSPAMGDKLTELTNATLSLVSEPAGDPTPATTATIQVLSDIGAAGEPWEGALVRLSNLKVTNNALGNGKIELTDNNSTKIVMDDDAFHPTTPTNGTCYATVTGIMSVQLTDNIRTINPRVATDLVTAGAACN